MKERSLQEISTRIASILEPTLRRLVKEEVEPILIFLQSSPRHSHVHLPESPAFRGLQLHFINKFPSVLFTNSRIENEEHDQLRAVLVDAKTNNVIQHGPLSSIKVEIVVLSADFAANGQENWTESEFNNSVLREREGKRPLLVGELSFSLVNGVGHIGNISFTDNSSWVRSRKFRLGVRAVSSASNGTGIREAVSGAFMVLDHRGESYQKHNTPSLGDPVWRLKKISKGGASHKKLELHEIKTVKDFLIQYHINPSLLRNVLGKGVSNKAWETMLEHANECHLEGTQYSYYNASQRVELLFNCVYKVIAVKFDGHDYQPVDALDSSQKSLVDKLKELVLLDENQLVPIHSSSATPPLVPSSVQPNIAFSSPNLDLEHHGLSLIDQDEQEKQLEFNLSESASYPCAVEDGYQPEEDSISEINQPVHGFSSAAFLLGAEPSVGVGGYHWYQNSPILTFAPNNDQFGELSHPQTSPLYSLANTWGQGNDGLLAASATVSHVGTFSQRSPSLGIDISATGKPKAGWCKIRAAVMWKIVRKIAAARRKGKFPFWYSY